MIPAAGLELGIVVAVYPQGQSVDVLLPDSGTRLTNVQVMVPTGSDSTGLVDLPDPGLPTDDTRWNITNNAARNIIAVIASYQGNPLCIGFLLPQITQMTFADKNRRIVRHASDVYSSIDQFGNIEVYHPSGTFWRIGTSPAHEDLTGKDFDGEWAIKNNTAAAPYLNFTLANGGVVKAQIQIDPAGNLTLLATSVIVTAPTTLDGVMTFNGNMTLTGNLSATGAVSLTGPVEATGAVTVAGALTATSVASTSGGGTLTTTDGGGGGTGPGTGTGSGGTVTSIGITSPSGFLSVSGGTVTTAGVITVDISTAAAAALAATAALAAAALTVTSLHAALPVTTKGDLLGYDTAPDRVPVGADGYVLTADSTQSAGIKWAAPTGGGGTPATIPDLVFWFQGDIHNISSGLPLPAMFNSTPWNANPASNAGVPPSTIRSATQLNGKNVFTWNGTSSGRYPFAEPIYLGVVTFFVVMNPQNSSSSGLPGLQICGNNGSMELTQDTNTAKVALVSANLALIAESTTALTNGTWYQINATYNTATLAYAFRTARSADGSGTASGVSISGPTTAIGYNPAVGSQDQNGSIAEIIIYSRVLTSAEILSVEAYLNAKWGV